MMSKNQTSVGVFYVRPVCLERSGVLAPLKTDTYTDISGSFSTTYHYAWYRNGDSVIKSTIYLDETRKSPYIVEVGENTIYCKTKDEQMKVEREYVERALRPSPPKVAKPITPKPKAKKKLAPDGFSEFYDILTQAVEDKNKNPEFNLKGNFSIRYGTESAYLYHNDRTLEVCWWGRMQSRRRVRNFLIEQRVLPKLRKCQS